MSVNLLQGNMLKGIIGIRQEKPPKNLTKVNKNDNGCHHDIYQNLYIVIPSLFKLGY